MKKILLILPLLACMGSNELFASLSGTGTNIVTYGNVQPQNNDNQNYLAKIGTTEGRIEAVADQITQSIIALNARIAQLSKQTNPNSNSIVSAGQDRIETDPDALYQTDGTVFGTNPQYLYTMNRILKRNSDTNTTDLNETLEKMIRNTVWQEDDEELCVACCRTTYQKMCTNEIVKRVIKTAKHVDGFANLPNCVQSTVLFDIYDNVLRSLKQNDQEKKSDKNYIDIPPAVMDQVIAKGLTTLCKKLDDASTKGLTALLDSTPRLDSTLEGYTTESQELMEDYYISTGSSSYEQALVAGRLLSSLYTGQNTFAAMLDSITVNGFTRAMDVLCTLDTDDVFGILLGKPEYGCQNLKTKAAYIISNLFVQTVHLMKPTIVAEQTTDVELMNTVSDCILTGLLGQDNRGLCRTALYLLPLVRYYCDDIETDLPASLRPTGEKNTDLTGLKQGLIELGDKLTSTKYATLQNEPANSLTPPKTALGLYHP